MNEPLGRLRVSLGYDSHRIARGRPLVLAGVRIEGYDGLDGHSDADVIAHAVIDALLSASRLGDIGKMFPVGDDRFSGADSMGLLKEASAASRAKGYEVISCDCTLIAERPKIAGMSDLMAGNLAGAMGIAHEAVAVKGKTNEGLDSIGRGEAMAAYAVLLVERTK